MASRYRTAPDPEFTGWPRGVPYIVGNEACERFSFYGMKSILWTYLAFVYCARYVVDEKALCGALETDRGVQALSAAQQELLRIPQDQATASIHFFITGVYALPMIGAIVSDRLLGKYRTILWLSIVYCAGHAVLALFEKELLGIYIGLALIAVGSGGIKPSVSAHVGDQFGKGNWRKVERVFQLFYLMINFGSVFATLLIPIIKEHFGWGVAFGVPGVLMGIATFVFWLGRKTFVHVPPHPGGRLGALDAVSSSALFLTVGSLFFTASMSLPVKLAVSLGFLVLGSGLFAVRQRIERDDGFLSVMTYKMFSKKSGSAPLPFTREAAEGSMAVLKVMSIFLFVSVFWSLFDQHASTWIRQAGLMDRAFDLPLVGRFTLLKEQTIAVNPVLVLLLIPALGFGVYPLARKMGIEPTPLRRMTAGMFIASLSFVAAALLQERIEDGATVHVSWQIVQYLLLTMAEVMVSITGLELAYTQAPRSMKSTIMGVYMLMVSLGNVITALFAAFGGLGLASFFWLFAGLMLGAAILFAVRAAFYTYQDFPQ